MSERTCQHEAWEEHEGAERCADCLAPMPPQAGEPQTPTKEPPPDLEEPRFFCNKCGYWGNFATHVQPRTGRGCEEHSREMHANLNRRAAEALGKPAFGEGSSWHDIPECITALRAEVEHLRTLLADQGRQAVRKRHACTCNPPPIAVGNCNCPHCDCPTDRDWEWWDALAGVPGVGMTPQDVKRWVLQEQALRQGALEEALEEAVLQIEYLHAKFEAARAVLAARAPRTP